MKPTPTKARKLLTIEQKTKYKLKAKEKRELLKLEKTEFQLIKEKELRERLINLAKPKPYKSLISKKIHNKNNLGL